MALQSTTTYRPAWGVLAATLAATLALNACTGVASPRPAPTAPQTPAGAVAPQQDEEVRIVVKEWGFEPAGLQIPVGRQVNLVLENRGALDHDLTVPGLNLKMVASPGKTARATVKAEKAGDYEVICSLAGHKESGMKGLLVSAAGIDHVITLNGKDLKPAQSAPQVAQHASHATLVATEDRGNQELPSRMEDGVRVFDLKAQHVSWEAYPGEMVDAYAYNGQVPGPVIRLTEGERFRLNFTNDLPEPSVVHFHGPRLPNAMDGVPDVTQEVVEPGASFVYEFVAKPSGTFVYHTHHNSAVQEPKGLYGMFIVEPPGGPRVQYDHEVFQVLSELGGNYVINGKAFPATELVEAKLGDKILVRLANLGQMPHPMHLHGHPFRIVATDGYPVPDGAQWTKDVVTIGPGERYDLLIEVDNPGTWVFHCHILSHVANHGVEPGGMITVIKVAE